MHSHSCVVGEIAQCWLSAFVLADSPVSVGYPREVDAELSPMVMTKFAPDVA